MLVADLNFIYVVVRILEFLNPDINRASLVCGHKFLHMQQMNLTLILDDMFKYSNYFHTLRNHLHC